LQPRFDGCGGGFGGLEAGAEALRRAYYRVNSGNATLDRKPSIAQRFIAATGAAVCF
jgi:hypothetical protein